MKIHNELETATLYFQRLPDQELFFKRVSKLSDDLVTPLLSSFGMMGKMAVQFVGKDRIIEIAEKNLILIAYRALKALEAFDALSLDLKLHCVADALVLLSKEGEEWLSQLHACVAPIHNKKERKKRRGEQHKIDLSPLAIEAAISLKPILFPDGYDSLYLPSGANTLVGKIEDNTDIAALVQKGVETVFHRDNKMNILFYLVRLLHRTACSTDDIPLVEKIPQECVEKLAPAIEPLVRTFVRSFSSYAHLLPKEMGASKVLGAIAGHIGNLTPLILSLVTSSEKNHDEAELIRLIERVSTDEHAARTVILRFIPHDDTSVSEGSPSFFDLISFTLKSSSAHFAAESFLSSVNWQEAVLSTLESFRCFAGSLYCDSWLLKTVATSPLKK